MTAAILAADPRKALVRTPSRRRLRRESGSTRRSGTASRRSSSRPPPATSPTPTQQSCDLIARALKILGDTRPSDERRSSAPAILANPQAAQQLLETAETTRTTQCAAAAARRAGNHPLADQLEATLPHQLRPTASADDADEPDQSGQPDLAAATDSPDESAGAFRPDLADEVDGADSAAGTHGQDQRSASADEPDQSGGSEEVVEPRRARVRCDRRPLTFGTAVVYYHLTRDTLDQILAAETVRRGWGGAGRGHRTRSSPTKSNNGCSMPT